jgi:hypothetical protein
VGPTKSGDANYVTDLFNNGLIPEPTLTFWYNTEAFTSEVVFGGVPSEPYIRDSLV